MADLERIELILHPVRLRILQTLLGEDLTTKEIAEQLPDVPASSIYRHLKLLLDGALVEVAEARLVHGIQEKVYHLAQSPHIGREEFAALPAADHFRYFTTYVLTLLQGFAAYLAAATDEDGRIDMGADYAGYTEASFFAADEELEELQAALNAALQPLLANEAGSGRHKHKLAIIAHPARHRTYIDDE